MEPVLARRPSMATSAMGSVQVPRRGLHAEFDFSLTTAKAKVLKAMDENMPAQFARFYQSPLFDRLLTGCTLYFISLLQKDALIRCMERARLQHLDGYNPYQVAARLKELESDAGAARQGLSAPYAEVLLGYSSYKKPQQDKRFFEAVYAALFALLEEALGRLGRMPLVAKELGALFRGKHFNSAARTYGPPRSIDTLTVTQVWSLKNESGNRSLHAKLISSLAEKPSQLPVQIAALSNTPLLTQAVSSPVVARSLLKDPQEREKMLNSSRAAHKQQQQQQRQQQQQQQQKAAAAGSTEQVVESRWKSIGAAAVGKQGMLGISATVVQRMQPSQTTLTAAGIVPSKSDERQYKRFAIAPDSDQAAAAAAGNLASPAAAAYGTGTAAQAAAATGPASPGQQLNTTSSAAGAPCRSSVMRPMQGLMASLPEAAGLPYDEGYAYLCLLRRYILYGPTFGLSPAATAGGSSTTGPANSYGAVGSSSMSRGSA